MIKRLYKGRTRKVFFLSLLFMFILSSSLYLDRDLNTQSTSDSGSDLIQNRRSDLEEGLGDEDILADDEIYNDDQTTHQTPRASDDANWWDEDFDRRLKLNVEEPGIGSREDEPVTYHAEFENSSCHINSTRIVKYQGGSQTEIPSQIWNIELWQENGGYSDYIKSCNITFMISISMSAINTYYLYYSSLAMNNNTQQYYSQTGFVSTLSGGRATVDTGELYSEFGVGSAHDTLKLSSEEAVNYHTEQSMSPSAYISQGGPYTPDEDGYFRDWLITGPFDLTYPETSDNWNSNCSTQDGNHVDTTIEYKDEDTATPEDPAIYGSDDTKIWNDYSSSSSNQINFDNIYSGVKNEYVAAYAMVYVHVPQDEPNVYMKLGSDDGIRVIYDLGAQEYYNHVARAASPDDDIVQISGGMSAGWHSFLVMVEERTGGWGFYFRLSRNGTDDGNVDPIDGLTLALEKPKVLIDSISLEQEGPVFSTYRVDWENSGDMKTTEFVSFYADMSMYKSFRVFGWDSDKNQASQNQNWTVTNTYYPSTSVTSADRFVQDTDIYPISSDGYISENLTFTYDYGKQNQWLTSGIFTTKSYSENQLLNPFSQANSSTLNFADKPQIILGYESDIDYTAPGGGYAYSPTSDYNIYVEYWEMLEKYIAAGEEDNIGNVLQTYHDKLLNPVLCYNNTAPEDLFFNLEFELFDANDDQAPNVNITLYNTTESWSGIHYTTNDQNSFEPIHIQTNSTGGIEIPELKGANYSALISYKAYNKPAFNFTSFSVYRNEYDSWERDIGWVNVTLNTTQKLSVYDLNLTKIDLVLKDSESSLESPEPIIGANVSLYWNNTDIYGNKDLYGGYVGSEQSDSDGKVSFYYLNSSGDAEGNYSVKVKYFGYFRSINSTYEEPGDIDKMINFSAPAYVSLTVDVILEEFDTTFKEILNPDIYWGQVGNILYNYTYNYSGKIGAISDAQIYYQLRSINYPEKGILNSGFMDETSEPGVYNLTFDSEDTAFGLDTNELFRVDFSAEASGFTPKQSSTIFDIDDIATSISIQETDLETYWLDNFSIVVDLQDTDNGVPLSDWDIQYSVQEEGLDSIQGILNLDMLTPGRYNMTFNTTSFLQAGTYTLEINASKQHYVNHENEEITVTINKIQTSKSLDKTSVEAFWLENVSVQFTFRDEHKDIPIIDGKVAFSSPQISGLEGNLTHNETNPGTYVLNINTTTFTIVGTYTIQITAEKDQYQTQSELIYIKINRIKTNIDENILLRKSIDVDVTTENLVYLNYMDDEGELISGADIVYYEWESANTDGVTIGDMVEMQNGSYLLDFNTENRVLGIYDIIVHLGKLNYEERQALITINIVEKQILRNFSGLVETGNFDLNQDNPSISAIKGQNIKFSLRLKDPITDAPLQEAQVTLSLLDLDSTFNFEESTEEPGLYTLIFTTDDYEAFTQDNSLRSQLSISKANYTTVETNMQITVKMEEIFSGVPQFYFILGVVGAGAIALSLVANKLIKQARIPGFVKLIDSNIETIEKEKDLSKDGEAETLNDMLKDKFSEKWELLDLNMNKALGVQEMESKRDKNVAPGDQGGLD